MEIFAAILITLFGIGVPVALLSKKKILSTLGLTPAGGTAAHQTMADQVAASGVAHDAAMALYGYLQAGGDPAQVPANIATFQAAHNSDPNAVTLTGPLAVNGVFDVPTSAALTLYSHDPIPPYTPPAPQPIPPQAVIMNPLIPGAAATSGFSLYTYLKAHGNDRSASLNRLVTQFQLDANTDPKFPGPSGAVGPRLIQVPITVNGLYTPEVQAALRILAPDAPNP